jgi:hypothetical protein
MVHWVRVDVGRLHFDSSATHIGSRGACADDELDVYIGSFRARHALRKHAAAVNTCEFPWKVTASST